MGTFSTSEMRAKLEKIFGGWTYAQPAVPAFPAVAGQAHPGVFLAEKKDVNQTFFHIGTWAVSFATKTTQRWK